MNVSEEARTIGRTIGRVRTARGKTLQVIADLAGMSVTTLWRIENGERAVNVTELAVIADALQISVQELTRLPVPAPANGHTDSAIAAIDRALVAVSHSLPDGQIQPVEQLRSRVMAALTALCRCEQEGEVGTGLPALIRDLHTSIAAGRNVPDLLHLATLLHTQITAPWLRLAGDSTSLRSLALMIARKAAQDHDTPISLGLVAVQAVRVCIDDGTPDLAAGVLQDVIIPTNTSASLQLAGLKLLRHSEVSTLAGQSTDRDAALLDAAEIARRTGEGNAFGLEFGPTRVGITRLRGPSWSGDWDEAVRVGDAFDMTTPVDPVIRAIFNVEFGTALVRVGRYGDAITNLRKAEEISPQKVARDPYVRGVLSELRTNVRANSPARSVLDDMVFRAGL